MRFNLAVDRDSERSADLAHTVVTETPNAFDPAAPRPRPPIKTGATRKRRKRNYDIVGERPQTVAVGGRDLHRRHLGEIYGIIASVTTSSPDPWPVRPVAAVDVRGVAEALDDGDRDTAWWYDPSSGQVEPGVAEWIADEFDDDDEPDGPWPGADRVGRFSRRYDDMVTFASAVGDRRAGDLLQRALEGRGAFRRFRDTLHEFEDLVGPWRAYAQARSEVRAIDWLATRATSTLPTPRLATRPGTPRRRASSNRSGSTTGLLVEVDRVTGRWADIERTWTPVTR